MSAREQRRLVILNELEGGRLRAGEGAQLMGLSGRQARRLRAACRREGAKAVAHGNRGRRPHSALEDEVALTRERYVGVNQQHLTELLEEDEGIRLPRATVRRVLLRVGIRSPQRRRAPKHRSRRERKPRDGMLLQVDGSPHDWLEGQGPRLCLMGAIDDATSNVPYAVFPEQEDIQGYFAMLRRIVETKWIPLSSYHDKHTVFISPKKEVETVEEQLAGKRRLTQVGRALGELGIGSIPADSPEAKGRIERLWRTFQDRLVSELRLADARDIDAANRTLHRFLPRYNRRFVVPPAEPECAYRPVDPGLDLATVFCLKHMRTVGRDNVVRFKGRRLQILPSHGKTSYARTRVEVHERMNDSIAIYNAGMRLSTTTAPLEATALRGRSKPQHEAATTPELHMSSPTTERQKPAPDHPWRTPFKPQRTKRIFSLTA